MKIFSKIWYWLVVIVVLILATGITILFAQTNDVHVSEETNLSDNTNKGDAAAKVEVQAKDPAPRDATVDIDPAVAIEIQRRFNELERSRLNNRSNYIDRWLTFIAIVLTFFGLVVVVLGYFGIKSFKELEADAKNYVEKIEEYHAQSKVHLQEMTSEEADDPDKASEVEEAFQDFQADPEPSLIDKTIAEIHTLRRDGRIEDAIEKWRSIANIAEGNDNNLAARAWLSIRYFLVQEEERHDAYNRAMNLDPNYTRSYISQHEAKYSPHSQHGIVVNKVLHYFEDPMYEKLSTAVEYRISSDPYRADVVLQDEEGGLVVIIECKIREYISKNTINQLHGIFIRSNAQFGLIAAGIEISKWTFYRILENGITEITRSQFEQELVGYGST